MEKSTKKEPGIHFNLRISPLAIAEAQKQADRKHLPLRRFIRRFLEDHFIRKEKVQ